MYKHLDRTLCAAAGDEAVVGSCPEARLLQAAMQACPYSAGWDTCDTSLCEFSTPSFIPSRVQPIGLGNATATVPTINEAAMQPNSKPTHLPGPKARHSQPSPDSSEAGHSNQPVSHTATHGCGELGSPAHGCTVRAACCPHTGGPAV